MPSEEAEDRPPPLHVSVLQRWLWATYLRDLEKEREGLWFLSRESDLSLLLSLERDLLETAAQEGCNTRTKLNSLRWHGCLKRLPLGHSGFSEGKPFQGYENNQLVPTKLMWTGYALLHSRQNLPSQYQLTVPQLAHCINMCLSTLYYTLSNATEKKTYKPTVPSLLHTHSSMWELCSSSSVFAAQHLKELEGTPVTWSILRVETLSYQLITAESPVAEKGQANPFLLCAELQWLSGISAQIQLQCEAACWSLPSSQSSPRPVSDPHVPAAAPREAPPSRWSKTRKRMWGFLSILPALTGWGISQLVKLTVGPWERAKNNWHPSSSKRHGKIRQ